MVRHEESIKLINRLQYQVASDHHESDTVVVSRALLGRVLERAAAVETYGEAYDLYYIDGEQERIGG
jgi:hypothetical protein